MKSLKKHSNPTVKCSLTALISCSFAVISSGFLSSCAYTETMNQREAEGRRLQGELGAEIEKGNRMKR